MFYNPIKKIIRLGMSIPVRPHNVALQWSSIDTPKNGVGYADTYQVSVATRSTEDAALARRPLPPALIEQGEEALWAAGLRWCTRCYTYKSKEDFYLRNNRPSGVQPHCIVCCQAEADALRERLNKPRLRKRHSRPKRRKR
jgi:hypothetical protein